MSRLTGLNAVSDLASIAPHAIDRLLVTAQAGPAEVRLAEQLRAAGIRVDVVPPGALAERAGGRGGATIGAEIAIARPAGLESYRAGPEDQKVLLALDHVTDPHNLGAILRTSAAFDVSAIIVPRNGSAPLTDAAVRASAGAAALVPIERVTNLSRAIRDLEGAGFWTCAITGDADGDVWEMDFRRMSWLFVLGAEGAGLRQGVGRACRLRARIDGGGRLGTLNVGVAAAVTVAEARRQHRIRI
jgi:23S rRNA (guanosine2251-2'-O)-methyltransferase